MLRVKDDVVGLINALKHQQPAVRLQAVRALTNDVLEPELALRRFTATLGDSDPAVRQAALQALEKLGRLAVPVMTRALSCPDPLLRAEAAHLLGRVGSPAAEAVPELIKLLNDDHRRVVQEAAMALGHIGSAARPAIPALIELLGDTHFLACRLAAWALVRIGPASVFALSETLQDPDPYVRGEAAWALAHLGPEAGSAVPVLTRLLRSPAAQAMSKVPARQPDDDGLAVTAPVFIAVRRDREENFWIWVIRALGNIGPAAADAITDLLRIARQGTGTFHLVAMQALRKIDPLTQSQAG
jgi:HEAT repeat protein